MASLENLAPNVVKRIAKELNDLQSDPPEDIKIIPNDDDLTDIQAVLTGPAGTPYEGGLFKVKLLLNDDFPNSPPKGFFITKIFHPNVSKTGEICVNTLKKDWKKELGIKHILLTVKCLLIVPNAESALNEEAGKLLLEKYEDYAKTARLMTSIHATRPVDVSGAGSSSTSSSTVSTSSAAAASTDADGSGGDDDDDEDDDEDDESDASTKKRAANKKEDKKKTDKKRSLKRL